MKDVTALRSLPERLGRLPRLLDAACGTGILLQQLLDQVPGVEAYGVDASANMLVQVRATLKDRPHVHIERVQIGCGETAVLPFTQESFDLITCTNALHDMPDPVGTLVGLKWLLAPGGQLVVEDFSRGEPLFLWAAFEWLLRRIEGSACVYAGRSTGALSASRTARCLWKILHRRLVVARLGVMRIWNIFRVRVGMHHVVTLLSSLILIQFKWELFSQWQRHSG